MNQPVSTTDKAQREKIAGSIKNASQVQIGTIEGVLEGLVKDIQTCKAQYDDLVTAITAKKEELKEVHDIEISANDLAALAAAQEKLIADKKEEAENISLMAKKIKEEADEYHEEKIDETHNQMEALKVETEKKRNRNEEEYIYNTLRKHQIEEDRVTDALSEKLKSLDEREKTIQEREAIAEEKDQKIEELTNKIADDESKIQIRIDEAFNAGKEKAERSAKFAASMVKASTDANAKIAESTIENLKLKVLDLEKQVEQLNFHIVDANTKIAEMAQSALKAKADAATISEVSKIAAGGGQKR